MTPIEEELRSIAGMPVAELAARYRDLTGREPRTRHRAWLERRVAWRLAERRTGGLSAVARRRIDELAKEFDLPLRDPDHSPERGPGRNAKKLPPGTVLTREYKGREIRVEVRDDGRIEHEGQVFRSLSAVALAVTGSRWNGKLFFGLVERAGKKKGGAR